MRTLACIVAPAACSSRRPSSTCRSGANAGSRATSSAIRRSGSMGHLAAARALPRGMAGWPNAPGDPHGLHDLHLVLAVASQCGKAMLRQRCANIERAANAARAKIDACELVRCLALTRRALVLAAQGKPRAALDRDAPSHRLHRAHDLAARDRTWSPQASGGRTARRLRANGSRPGRARSARDGVPVPARRASRSLSDEGLRRNYLNKVDDHREIVARVAQGRAQAPAVSRAARRASRGRGRICASRSSGWSTPGCASTNCAAPPSCTNS